MHKPINLSINANWFKIFCASPLVGSEMYEICQKKGYLKEGYIGSNYRRAAIETEDFTADYIQKKAYMLNLELNFVSEKPFWRKYADMFNVPI